MRDSFIDTNVVIYRLGQQGIKQAKAIELLASKPVMSIQV